MSPQASVLLWLVFVIFICPFQTFLLLSHFNQLFHSRLTLTSKFLYFFFCVSSISFFRSSFWSAIIDTKSLFVFIISFTSLSCCAFVSLVDSFNCLSFSLSFSYASTPSSSNVRRFGESFNRTKKTIRLGSLNADDKWILWGDGEDGKGEKGEEMGAVEEECWSMLKFLK